MVGQFISLKDVLFLILRTRIFFQYDGSVCSPQMNSISLVCFLLWTGASSFQFEELKEYVDTHQEEYIEVFLGWDVIVVRSFKHCI